MLKVELQPPLDHPVRHLVLLLALTLPAWASSPTPEQGLWLSALFANLLNGAPSAEVEAYWTELVVSGTIDIEALSPPRFGGSSPQMFQETCDLLAATITSKTVECATAVATVKTCEVLASTLGQDPAVFCQAQRANANNCTSVLTAYVTDWNQYCD
jgi:hypothetical protein